MRNYPNMNDEWDQKEVARLQPEDWMLEALKMNPEYVYWGPHEDYMLKDSFGWESRILIDDWKNFDLTLDDYNECVNFYFKINRDKETSSQLSLVLWILHPRKGASRGVEVKNIKKDELKEAVEWLQEAAERNTNRFSKLSVKL